MPVASAFPRGMAPTGARQFVSLLKKNVLLKARRPRATCCELFAPIILILLLAYTRVRYKVHELGPYYFAHNPIYPISRVLTGTTPDSQGAEEMNFNGYVFDSSDFEDSVTTVEPNLGSAIIEEWICRDPVHDTAIQFFETVLGWSIDGNQTVEDWLRTADPAAEGENFENTIRSWQDWDVDAFVQQIDEARLEYLNSDLPGRVEEMARLFDAEIQGIHEDLDDEAAFRLRAEGWVDGICNLSGDYTRVWDEEWRLNYSFGWDARFDNWIRVPHADGSASVTVSVNASKLAQDLVALRDMIDSSGMEDWLRSLNTSAWMFRHVSVEDIMATVEHVFWDVENMTDGQMNDTADRADQWIWWLSHFLKKDGLMARLLGESSGDVDWTSVATGSPSASWLMTDPGAALWRGMWHVKHEDDWHDAMDGIREAIDEVTITTDDSGTVHVETGSDSWTVSLTAGSLVDDVLHLMDELEGKTALEIEAQLLEEWELEWTQECNSQNLTGVVDKVVKTHMGCPFYRSTIEKLAEHGLSELVQDFHQHLEDFNPSSLSEHLEHMKGTLRHVDPAHAGGTLELFIENAQETMDADENATTTDIAEALWHSSREEILDRLNIDLDCNECSRRLAGDSDEESYSEDPEEGRLRRRRLAEERQEDAQMREREHDGDEQAGATPRRAAEEDEGTDLKAKNFLQEELMRRKILVAPYLGETKRLVDLVLVESGLSLLGAPNGTGYEGFLAALTRCPLTRTAAARFLESFLAERMLTFPTEDALEDYAERYPDDVLAGIVFRSADPVTGNFPPGGLKVEYAIRMHAQLLPETGRILKGGTKSMYGSPRFASYKYLVVGFNYLQEAVGRASARLRAGREATVVAPELTEVGINTFAHDKTHDGRKLTVSLEQFPSPVYNLDRFIRVIQHTMPLFMIMGWIYPVALLVKEVVYEKQEHLRDVMRIMGLKTWVYWASWMVSAMIQMSLLVSIMTFVLARYDVLKHTDVSVVFFFFLTYSMSAVSMSLLISTFFSRAKVAAACGGLIYYILYMPYALYTRFEDIITHDAKNALALMSPTGMGIGMSLFAKWELMEEGAHWSNLWSPPPVTNTGYAPKDDHSLGDIMVMFIVDTALYLVLAWYVDKVRPGTLGIPQPWYFPLLPSYWFPKAPGLVGQSEVTEGGDFDKILECWEAAPAGLEKSVVIRQLSKTFGNGTQALKGISLEMHKGTIVGLLGHNGAGKSTTMAILSGLYPATGGDVHVNGVSVHKDSLGVRRQLGVCPQHNALWETMTVEEHLHLFCTLKQVPWGQVAAAAEQLVCDTGLAAKRHAVSRALSGGMKRKLSIGIALAGGSRVVTLDEPTAGVDATSRRDIWRLLAAYKADRTILLSTHFMDEADILSDRIAIIAEGRLTAIGSSMALKRHYADGYMLVLVAANDANAGRLESAIRACVPEGHCVGCRGREYSFLLPFSARDKFAALFTRLQSSEFRASRGIDSYGLSAPTMEEVFLRASSMHETGLKGQVRNAGPSEVAQVVSVLPGLPALQLETSSEGAASSEGSTRASSSRCAARQDTPPRVPSKEGALEDVLASMEVALKSSAPEPQRTLSTAFTTQDANRTLASEDSSLFDTAEAEAIERRTTPSELSRDAPSSEALEAGAAAKSVSDDGAETPTQSGSSVTPPRQSSDSSSEVGSPSSWKKMQVDAANEEGKVKALGITDEDPKHAAAKAALAHASKSAQRVCTPKLSGPLLQAQQFAALITKRALAVRRDRKAWASQLMLPAAFVAVALLIAKLLEVQPEEPPILLSTSMFIGTVSAGGTELGMERHTVPFAGEGGMSERVADAFQSAGHAHNDFPFIPVSTPMSEYLMDNSRSLSGTYGAVTAQCTSDHDLHDGSNVTLWFQNTAYHIMPVMVNLWNNARLHLLGYDDSEVKVWSHPLPKTHMLLKEEMTGDMQILADLTVAITVILAMGFVPASFIVHIVHEKATNGKHQQLLTGVRPVMYWATNYAWDMLNYLIPMAVCAIIFASFGVAAYSGDNAPAIALLLLLYGVSVIPYMYCYEPIFKVPSTAYVSLICLNIMTGTVSVLATSMMDMYENEVEDLKPMNKAMQIIFPWVLPNYCLGRGMVQIAMNHYLNHATEQLGICAMVPGREGCTVSPFDYTVSGRFLMTMALSAPLWFMLRLLIEWGFCTRGLRNRALSLINGTAQEVRGQDEAVDSEADRVANNMVQSGSAEQGDRLVISKLGKTFVRGYLGCRGRAKTVSAVRGISVGVPAGECFGLLGVNGAGKTTTMRMITGDTEVGSGDIIVGGWSVHSNRDRARQHLGYCPQFDALPDKLSVRETLALYARIRGIPRGQVRASVDHMISHMCLEAHHHQLCEHLSGGNKRKLSTALALIGEPDVVLLDEPSTGVDVGARRFLWEIISGIRQRGHAIILTSHFMEECEVLCTRLTIMSHGRFRCLGSPVQLKAKYGGGYTLAIKAQQHEEQDDHSPVHKIRSFCASSLPAAVLAEESLGLFRYRIGAKSTPSQASNPNVEGNQEDAQLGNIFQLLEDAIASGGQLEGCISDYTISQTSLEEVFLHFSREAKAVKAAEENMPHQTAQAAADP